MLAAGSGWGTGRARGAATLLPDWLCPVCDVWRVDAGGVQGLECRPEPPVRLRDLLEPRGDDLSEWTDGGDACRDGAIQDLLATEVLKPALVERALDRALTLIQTGADGAGRRRVVERDLEMVDAELRNLAETAAKGGAVPVVLEALDQRDVERRRLLAELDGCEAAPPLTLPSGRALRAQLSAFLDDWRGLLSGNVSEARPLLDLVLADRIAFQPTAERRYELTVPITFNRVMTAIVPDLRGLQDSVASSTGPNRLQTPINRWFPADQPRRAA